MIKYFPDPPHDTLDISCSMRGKFMKRYFDAIQNYFNFRGRASRADYWFFILFNFLIGLLVGVIDVMLFGLENVVEGVPIFSVVYNLFIIIPTLALSARRLHDTGRSGLWFLIGFVPIIGSLILLVFFLQPSQLKTNQWGPHPVRRHPSGAYSY